jgi:hypothetical protein
MEQTREYGLFDEKKQTVQLQRPVFVYSRARAFMSLPDVVNIDDPVKTFCSPFSAALLRADRESRSRFSAAALDAISSFVGIRSSSSSSSTSFLSSRSSRIRARRLGVAVGVAETDGAADDDDLIVGGRGGLASIPPFRRLSLPHSPDGAENGNDKASLFDDWCNG